MILRVILLLLVVNFGLHSAFGDCVSDNYSNLPSAPGFASTPISVGLIPNLPVITGHWSERSNYAQYRPPPYNAGQSTALTGCPYQQEGIVYWHDSTQWSGQVPANGSDVTLPAGVKMVISSCSVDPSTIFGIITIPVNTSLIFADAPISFQAHGFVVHGSLLAGSSTCRLRHKISITLWGKRSAQALPADPQVKGIAVYGSIDIHGNQYYPTWTRLAITANINDTYVFLQDKVNWQPDQQIIVTTTELKDSREFTHTEVRTIAAVYTAPTLGSSVSVLKLTAPLDYLHYAGREYQAEVALLSRDILIQGDPLYSEPTDNKVTCYDSDLNIYPPTNSTYPCDNQFLTGFGGHVQVIGSTSAGRFSGVELYRMGQTNVMARYPLHFHMMFEQSPTTASISDCSVHRSFYRCYVVHGTNNTLITQNTAYDAIGNCFYMSENGVEERSTISYNLAALVHPLGNPAITTYQDPVTKQNLDGDGWYAQYLDYFEETADLLIPADLSAAGFYITNCYNSIFGNAAAGGWTGFSFPSLIAPIGNFADLAGFNPSGRPFLTPFRGNTAHSSGFWWASAGAFYFGGVLEYTDASKTKLHYTAGRSLYSHDTCTDFTAGTPAGDGGCYSLDEQLWLRLEDNKAFLAHRGLQAWGNRAEIIRMEMHDVSLSMNVFGKVWIDELLMECRSNHTPNWFANCAKAQGVANPPWNTCSVRDWYFFNALSGFQWYDVGQDHILSNSIFRNCRNDWYRCVYGTGGKCGGSVFQSLTHSDQFVPEVMQITKNITFDNCNNLRSYSTGSTGNPLNQTVSGRLQNWLDWDGSVSGLGVKSQLGSNRSRSWWDYTGSCVTDYQTFMCAQGANDGQASVILNWNSTYQATIGNKVCSNGDTTIPCPVIGQVTHFGRAENNGLLLGVDSKITGPVIHKSGGWFIHLTGGTPKQVTFSNIQIDPQFNLVLALPYPAGTTFNVTYNAASWCGPSWATCQYQFQQAGDLNSVYNGAGNLYFFSGTVLYIRITMQPSTWTKGASFASFTTPDTFTRDGMSLFLASQSSVQIKASCLTDPCPIVNPITVPNEINPDSATTTTKLTTTTKPTTTTTTTKLTTTTTTTKLTTTTKPATTTTTKPTTTTAKPATTTTAKPTTTTTAKPATTTTAKPATTTTAKTATTTTAKPTTTKKSATTTTKATETSKPTTSTKTTTDSERSTTTKTATARTSESTTTTTKARSAESRGCFAASSLVRVLTADGEVVNKKLSDLTVGELVQSFDGDALVFSPVYYIAHAGDQKEVDVVSLKVAERTSALTLTSHHLLLAASNLLATPELKPAGEVEVGEFLVLVTEEGTMARAQVTSSKQGTEAVRNPLTLNNNIVVSDFACSAFAHSASFYSVLTKPLQALYHLVPSAFQANSLLVGFIDAVVALTDWFESNSSASASLFVSSSPSW